MTRIMDRDAAWSVFEDTGDINMYLIYSGLGRQAGSGTHREETANAVKDRRAGDKGPKRR